MPLRIERVVLRQVRMPLVAPFEASHGRVAERRLVIVEVLADGLAGYGECCAQEAPTYHEETVGTAWLVLRDFLVPLALGRDPTDPREVGAWFGTVRGNRMARAALEAACWDLAAQAAGQPLHRLLGGARERVEAGVSVGLQPTAGELVHIVASHLASGYRRVKIKIAPGRDVAPVAELRRALGDFPLMVDANGAYSPGDLGALRALDAHGLTMIEQPLAYDDLWEHARLQRELRTPVCLDESVRHARDAAAALGLGACRVVNVKAARVGGLAEACRVHDVCHARGVPVWCGGMLETGIGRAHNIALASLPGFSLPGDLSASARYWERDIIDPPVVVGPDGTIAVPQAPGRGFAVDVEALEHFTEHAVSLSRPPGRRQSRGA